MKKSSNRGSVIFLSIIAFAGLGLSGYMFTMDLISEEPNFREFKTSRALGFSREKCGK